MILFGYDLSPDAEILKLLAVLTGEEEGRAVHMPDGNAVVVAVGGSGQLDNVLACGKGRLEGDHIPAAVREAGDSHIDKRCSGDALCIVGVKCEDLNGDSVVCVGVIGCGVEVQSLEGCVAVCNDAVSVALFQVYMLRLGTVNVGWNSAFDCLKPACTELFRCFGRYGGGGFSAAVLCAFDGSCGALRRRSGRRFASVCRACGLVAAAAGGKGKNRCRNENKCAD